MDRRKVYVYETAGEHAFEGIACDCQLWDNPGFKGLVFLTPPGRGHMIDGEFVGDTPHGFIFKATKTSPGEWEFNELTIDNLKREYHRLVIGGTSLAETIQTTDELYEWFRNEFHFGQE
jgi:hypothetical protein